MPKIQPHIYVPQNPRSLEKLHEHMAAVVNGQLSFGDGSHLLSDNIDGKWVQFTTPSSPSSSFIVTHNLGRPVSGMIEGLKNGAGDVYLAPGPIATTNTNTTITLRSTSGSITTTMFFF